MRLSKAIRVYEHDLNGAMLGRDNFNWWQGMTEIDLIKIDPSAKIIATGSESGAMCVHYKWLH